MEVTEIKLEKINEIKLMKYGFGGFEITIPKVWISDNKLNGGDKIDVFREGEKLIIKPKEIKKTAGVGK